MKNDGRGRGIHAGPVLPRLSPPLMFRSPLALALGARPCRPAPGPRPPFFRYLVRFLHLAPIGRSCLVGSGGRVLVFGLLR
jgi:hypothetical protein